MEKAVRIPLLAGAIVAAMSASAATTAIAGATLWDGTIVVTSATQQCTPKFDCIACGSIRAMYRPHLKASDPKAAVLLYGDHDGEVIVIRATTDTRQMQGNGDYCGIAFIPSAGESQTWFGGTSTFNVTPANVTAATNIVRITGTVTKFGNIPGCTVTFRAAFMRQPPEQP
jgi:hypothetical protein